MIREKKYHLYLSDDEYGKVVSSLLNLKNSLIQQGRYTDAVDDTLCKLMKAHKTKLKVVYK